MRGSKLKPEEHYVKEFYIRYVEGLQCELGRRFGKPQQTVFRLRYLIPSHMDSAGLTDAAAVLSHYEPWHKVRTASSPSSHPRNLYHHPPALAPHTSKAPFLVEISGPGPC